MALVAGERHLGFAMRLQPRYTELHEEFFCGCSTLFGGCVSGTNGEPVYPGGGEPEKLNVARIAMSCGHDAFVRQAGFVGTG